MYFLTAVDLGGYVVYQDLGLKSLSAAASLRYFSLDNASITSHDILRET